MLYSRNQDVRDLNRGNIRTIRLIRRLFSELPEPARTYERWFVALCAVTVLTGVTTRLDWVMVVGIGVAGVFLVLFGWCVFRDVNGAASAWSTFYRESKGIAPEGFTLADVPTLKAMGFWYMLVGAGFLLGAVVGSVAGLIRQFG